MENTATLPSVQPMAQELPVEKSVKAKKDHWMVEVAGGITLASTMVSALAIWFLVAEKILTTIS